MTTASSPAALIEPHFGTLKDPISRSRIECKLRDIPIITMCAMKKGLTTQSVINPFVFFEE